MRQMLALCITFSANVPLMILDEPTSSLDPTVRGEILALVRDARRQGRTVVFSSHVLSEVENVCDRVTILRRGQVVHQQALAELTRQHRIRARVTAPIDPPPEAVGRHISELRSDNGQLEIVAPGPLAPLLSSVTRPFLRPFQKLVPTIANVDLSPLCVLIICQLLLTVPLTWLDALIRRML